MGWWLLAAFAGAVLLTGLLRRYALAASLLDQPNARSSHQIPTPRGGGVAIVLVSLSGFCLLGYTGAITFDFMKALSGAGALVAIVGFMDDHGHIKARWRLLAHFVAAGWGLYGLQGLPVLSGFGLSLNAPMLAYILGALYLVWLLNLYNFMDGIDGIAGIEAISVCLGGSLLLVANQLPIQQSYGLWIVASAAAGFLYWNFPSARIFMGDAGSGFLGIILGLFSIQAAWLNPDWFWSWLILLGVFIVDATWTLTRRFLRGEKVYQAHRSHAYQYAARRYHSHKVVSLTVALINLVWLCPLALAVGMKKIEGLTGLGLAYLPLFYLAHLFNAGKAEH